MVHRRKVFGIARRHSPRHRGGVKPGEDKDQTSDWVTQARRRLATKLRKKPETKAAQIWAVWPEIKKAIAGGQRMNTICVWLQEAEIEVTPKALSSYITRCRRKERLACPTPSAQIRTEKLTIRWHWHVGR